jgi:hypothetical protein
VSIKQTSKPPENLGPVPINGGVASNGKMYGARIFASHGSGTLGKYHSRFGEEIRRRNPMAERSQPANTIILACTTTLSSFPMQTTPVGECQDFVRRFYTPAYKIPTEPVCRVGHFTGPRAWQSTSLRLGDESDENRLPGSSGLEFSRQTGVELFISTTPVCRINFVA